MRTTCVWRSLLSTVVQATRLAQCGKEHER